MIALMSSRVQVEHVAQAQVRHLGDKDVSCRLADQIMVARRDMASVSGLDYWNILGLIRGSKGLNDVGKAVDGSYTVEVFTIPHSITLSLPRF